VVAPGAVGSAPEVSFSAPLTAADTERTVLTVGTGVPVQTGDYVELGVAFYNGRTGAKIDARGFGPGTSGLDTGAPVRVDLAAPDGTLPAILKGVTCSTVGSRVAVVASPVDAWGAKENIDLDLHANDNVVIVVDVLTAAATAPVATDVPATGAPDTNVG
jgi:peptidylprolyl isomerase